MEVSEDQALGSEVLLSDEILKSCSIIIVGIPSTCILFATLSAYCPVMEVKHVASISIHCDFFFFFFFFCVMDWLEIRFLCLLKNSYVNIKKVLCVCNARLFCPTSLNDELQQASSNKFLLML